MNRTTLWITLFFASWAFCMESMQEKEILKTPIPRELSSQIESLLEKNDFDGYFALIDQLDQFKVEQQKLLEFSGGAAIHWAALHGNCQAIKKLVQRGTSVEVRNSEGCTALHIAAHAKRFNAMKTLRELGADAYASNNNGDTPLDIDDTDTVDNPASFLQQLLRLEDIKGPHSRREKGSILLTHAAERGFTCIVKKLLADDRLDPNIKNDEEETALHLAIKFGHLTIVELLVQDKRTDRYAPDGLGNTPLHLAAIHNKPEMAKLLVLRDKYHDLRLNKMGQTARQLGQRYPEVKSVFATLDPITPHIPIEDENTSPKALEQASSESSKNEEESESPLSTQPREGMKQKEETPEIELPLFARVKQLILQNKFEELFALVDSQNQETQKKMYDYEFEDHKSCSKKPIHWAAYHGNCAALKELHKRGVSIKSTNNAKHTALHTAAAWGQIKAIQTLVELGADIEANDGLKNKPFHSAALHDQVDSIIMLKKLGADLEAVNSRLWTPFFVAASRGHINSLKVLKDLKANIMAMDRDLMTTLHYAAGTGAVEKIKILTDLGISVDARGMSLATPLHLAARCPKKAADCIRYLIALGAKLEAGTRLNHTPLFLAAQQGIIENVACLLELGANPYEQNILGKTSFDADTAQCIPALLRLQDMQGPNSKRQNGNTLLMDAAQNHACIVQDLLADERLDVSAKNNDGETALHMAAKAGNLDSIHLLLKDRRTDQHAQDKDGNTPLHVAAQSGKIQAVGLFLLHDRLHASRLNKAGKTARELGDLAVQRLFDHMDQIHEFFAFWKAQPKHTHSIPSDLHQQLIGYLHYA